MYKVEDRNGQDEIEAPFCKQHGRKMIRKGKSERGFPTFFCESGRQIEKGQAKVKKVFEDRGFGFLKVSATDDLFFHFSQLKENTEVRKGDTLEFKVAINPRKEKLQAVDIEKVNGNSYTR